MQIAFRWYGANNDSVTLRQIKQIPGTASIVWALHHKKPGELWTLDEIEKEVTEIKKHGFHFNIVESVNIHEDIKLGLPSRDEYIANYKQTIRNLAASGVDTICYNFMPVFDWIRTDLNKELADGSTAMFYEAAKINNITPQELVSKITEIPDFTMPGWEPDRLKNIQHLIEQYHKVSKDTLWDNLQYFLNSILPVCEEHGVRMAVHPDDPPWPLFGLPRIMNSYEDLERLLQLSDSSANGITLCTGSLGAKEENNLSDMIYAFKDRIYFAHVRNVRRYENGDFIETSHRTRDGSVNIAGIMRAFHDIGYDGYIRPDHGRQIWDEQCRPGYGLYDRALGIMYLLGIWDTLQKGEL
ncbi:mannonate dehydratase [Alteribacillus sp. HJP-4]|uniref:mannonate dehydratase n=1 Tax=Alteribacillus sp. HJP-4 TaxID=2775394 RepID=UPI0035CCE751